MEKIDGFLNGITMYRLVLYVLICYVGWAAILTFLGILPFGWGNLALTALCLLSAGLVTNYVLARIFMAPVNPESVYITALILTLIVTPAGNISDLSPLLWMGVWASAGKFILAVGRKHLFNPAAAAVFLGALVLKESASWWVGMPAMLPLVVAGGLLIVRKVRHFGMLFYFMLGFLAVTLGMGVVKGIRLPAVFYEVVADSPAVFFVTIMLTEPVTTPPTRRLQSLYGVLTGVLSSPQFSIAGLATTPESALLLGNAFSFLVSPKGRLVLTLKKKTHLAPDIIDFVFRVDKKIDYKPGQYLEWTLSHRQPDSRSSRRYFTLASSPTEADLRIGVRFHPVSSSFKKSLATLKPADRIVAGQPAGDFTLPDDGDKKLAFVAGGIGVTPFRSMVRYLLDRQEKRDIVLIYASKTTSGFVYKRLFDKAGRDLNIRTVYTLTDTENIPPGWGGSVGYIDQKLIRREIPDYLERIFYVSGPYSMVKAFKKTLRELNVSGHQIREDFFPGFA